MSTILDTPAATSPAKLSDKLRTLHDAYAAAIDDAVRANHLVTVYELAGDYDREALLMMAAHEGRPELLAHFGLDAQGQPLATRRDSALHRIGRMLSLRPAA